MNEAISLERAPVVERVRTGGMAPPARPSRRLPATAERQVVVRGRWSARLGTTLLVLAALIFALLLVLPVAAILARALAGADALGAASQPVVVEALRLSLLTTALTLVLTLLFGTPVAWLLARRDFPGRAWLDGLIELPMVLPPAVAGIGLLMAFGRRGLLGPLLASLGLTVGFTTAAVVLAQVFVAAPFYVRAARVGFQGVDRELEEMAATLGGSGWTIFWRVTVPLALPSLLTGAAMCWARALGEFGATIMFAGSFQGRTQTMPLAIYSALESDLDAALALSAILVVVSFGLLGLVRLAARRSGSPEADTDFRDTVRFARVRRPAPTIGRQAGARMYAASEHPTTDLAGSRGPRHARDDGSPDPRSPRLSAPDRQSRRGAGAGYDGARPRAQHAFWRWWTGRSTGTHAARTSRCCTPPAASRAIVRTLVGREGLEGALTALAKAGVFLTFDEMKGRQPAIRGSQRFTFREDDFDSTVSRPHLIRMTGGTSSRPGRVGFSLAFLDEWATTVATVLEAHEINEPAAAFWWPVPVAQSLMFARIGRPSVGWFYPVHPLPRTVPLAAGYVRWIARTVGHAMPRPQRCDLDTPGPILAWAVEQLATGRPLVLWTTASAAARLGIGAREAGVSLRGLTTIIGSEAVTEARRQHVEASAPGSLPSTAPSSCRASPTPVPARPPSTTSTSTRIDMP